MTKEEKLNIKAMGIKKVKVRIMCNDFLRRIIKYECRGFTILFLLLFVSLDISGQTILLDKTNGQRISYAQILNNKGAVIGTTDIDGMKLLLFSILPISLKVSNHLYLRQIPLFI